jgi:glutamate synthase (NADPH/NADH) small chain
VDVFEARPKPGGLNEYGIAAYKLADDFAQREVAFILSVGGITVTFGCQLGRDLHLATLCRDYDAVFLGLGLAGVRALEIEGEALAGVRNAVDFIAELRQAENKGSVAVGRRVVVIGGGNTAIDAATQAKRLGAEDVTIVYRRGQAEMSATHEEQEWAQTNGVRILHWAAPLRLLEADGHVIGVEFARTAPNAAGRALPTGERFNLPADMVLKAVGQLFVPDKVGQGGTLALTLEGERIAVDADRRTSIARVYAGGDCIPGVDLTVAAVEDGKVAAEAIHRELMG